MAKLIGDRSFVLSNMAASEMTPEMVVERVKRSCDVKDFDVTVVTMKSGHDEEQKAIAGYWAQFEEEKKKEDEAKRQLDENESASQMEKLATRGRSIVGQ